MVTTITVPSVPDHHTEATDCASSAAVAVSAWCALVLSLLARAYRACFLTLVIAALLPTLWSWSSYVVRSGSMEPTLSVGDVVIGKPSPADSAVPVGRVMLFTPPSAVKGHEIVVHRVVENLGQGRYVTAGDANRNDDTVPVPTESFLARALLCVPFAGLPLVWWTTKDLVPLGIWVIVTMAAFYFSSRSTRRGRDLRHEVEQTTASATEDGPSVTDDRTRSLADADALRQTTTSARDRLRRGSAGMATAAIALVIASGALPVAAADAAFTDRALNAGNTWTVAVSEARANASLGVYDTADSSGWYRRSSVTAYILARASSGSGVRSITYRVNGGAPVTSKTSSLAFTVSAQGDNVITYFATDTSGVAEPIRTAHVKLDNGSPTLTVTSRTGDMTHAQWRAACSPAAPAGGLCGTTSDGVGSAVASVTYVLTRSSDYRCFNGTSWTTSACSVRTPATLKSGAWTVSVPDAALPVSRTWYTITVYAEDVAHNQRNTTRNFSVG